MPLYALNSKQMRILFIIILIFHGLIHLMGFVKAFQFAEMNQLQAAISKPMGVLWLIAAILFVVAIVMFYVSDYWFIPAVTASFVSSALIITAWNDARFGMIPNVVILIVCFLTVSSFSFKNAYLKDVKTAAKSNSTKISSMLTAEDIQNLPAPVQSYIRLTGSIGKPKVQKFKAEFEGKIRKKEQSEWMTFKCEQHNFMTTPIRLFFMDARMKGLPFAGYHHFKNGKAVMDIRLLSLLKVQYAKGVEMDISETVTFFNDMCCMAPATLIDKRIQWVETENNKVKCSFTNNGITIYATLFFNEKGELVNFISNNRFAYNENGKMTCVPWQTPVKAYKSVNGYYLPSQAELVYNYPEGDLSYGMFNLKSIRYNLEKLM